MMGWLLGWMAFGLLAAYDAGELALHAGTAWTPVEALAALLVSLTCLAKLMLGAIKSAAPRSLIPPAAFCLVGAVACVWWLYEDGHAAELATTVIAAAVYLSACLCLTVGAMALAWRRQRADQDRAALAMIERERHNRLERILAESAAPADSDSDADGEAVEDRDFRLPTRPKWDEM